MPPRKRDPKLDALLKHGTANPKPEAVEDPLFQQGEFFDPRDLVQVKYEMLRRVRSDGQSVADAAASFGVSRPTYYKALSDFECDGLAGLLSAKRGPHGPHKLTEEVMELIRSLLGEEPGLDAAALAHMVAQRIGLSLHPRTIERALLRSKKKRL